jgi:hypothetical protein
MKNLKKLYTKLLVMKATLQVPDLLTHDTNLLGLPADLLGEAFDFLGIVNKTSSLLCDDALSVVLQLKQMLDISSHVRPATVLMNLKDITTSSMRTFHSGSDRS